MKILFIHQNFPAQFKFLAPALARQGHDVRALTMRKVDATNWRGVRVVPYAAARNTSRQIHPWVSDFETKTIRGEACLRAARDLGSSGFTPDIVIAHPGWGESLFVKDVWPKARLGIYCEFYYLTQGGDLGFDPEFPITSEDEYCRLRLKNINNLLHFEIADAGISPTKWQASTYPRAFQKKITVVHDGIDTEVVRPRHDASLMLKTSAGKEVALSRSDEVITFVNRNLEPHRGYHVFMRALPDLLRRRPSARVMIVGGDDVSYGARPIGGGSWKDIFIREARPSIPDSDWARVHFLGRIPYSYFLSLLQISTVHVYLTYPFVLSWSLLEAMSAGCAVVGSDTAPLHEVIQNGVNGRLVDFFDAAAIVNEICELSADESERQRLGANARMTVQDKYDLRNVCLPGQLAWVASLAGESGAASESRDTLAY